MRLGRRHQPGQSGFLCWGANDGENWGEVWRPVPFRHPCLVPALSLGTGTLKPAPAVDLRTVPVCSGLFRLFLCPLLWGCIPMPLPPPVFFIPSYRKRDWNNRNGPLGTAPLLALSVPVSSPLTSEQDQNEEQKGKGRFCGPFRIIRV